VKGRTRADRLPGPLRSLSRAVWPPLREFGWLLGGLLARPHPNPVFVLGNQKSGTSAIAALLGLSTGLSVAVDLRREMQRQTWLRVRRGDLSFDSFVRRNALDFSRAIVKEPNLTFFHDELIRRAPSARCVFVVRDPRDNVASILDRLGIPGNLAALGEEQCAAVDPGSELVLDGSWLGIEAGGHYVERLAARWNACVDVYLARQADLVLVRYEDFVADKVGEIERLAARLGLEGGRDIRGRVDTPFQPAGSRSSDWSTFFGQENLTRIERICGDRMRTLDSLISHSPPISHSSRRVRGSVDDRRVPASDDRSGSSCPDDGGAS
jgi:hypothetical protein